MFESTIPSAYSYIHIQISPNTPNYYRYQDAYVIHKWCTLFEPTIPGVCSHIYTTLHTNCCRHQDVCMVHRWCTLFEFTIPSVYYTYTHQIILNLYYRRQDSCVVHRLCTLFEFTIPCVYSYIHIRISPSTQTTIAVRMHTWFTSETHCSSSVSYGYIPHTHTTILELYRNQDAFEFTRDAHISSSQS